MVEEVKLCPFCDKDGRVVSYKTYSNCLHCGAESSKWNTRPIEDALRTENAKLKKELIEEKRECFNMASTQCHGGYGDDSGNHRCEYQARIEDLEEERKHCMVLERELAKCEADTARLDALEELSDFSVYENKGTTWINWDPGSSSGESLREALDNAARAREDEAPETKDV